MKNYCALPFAHLCTDTLGYYQVCCQHSVPESKKLHLSEATPNEWLNHQYLYEVRESFRQDLRHPGCNACWKQEDSGIPSLRQRIDKEYKILCSDPFAEKMISVELQAGNLCNLTCIMCNEQDSSAILFENKKLGINILQQNNFKWEDNTWNNFKAVLDMNPRVLNIRGGEPLYSKKLLEIVESLSDEQCSKMLLHITTNATVWNQRWENALQRFKLVRLMLSIDAVGSTYEYIRYPSKWTEIENNVKQITSNKNFKVLIYSVVQNLNIGVLEELIDWCNEKKLNLQLHRLGNPDYLDFTNLPDNVIFPTIQQLERCQTKVQDTMVKSFIQSAVNELKIKIQKGHDNKKWENFISAMSLRESIRNNDYRKVLKYYS